MKGLRKLWTRVKPRGNAMESLRALWNRVKPRGNKGRLGMALVLVIIVVGMFAGGREEKKFSDLTSENWEFDFGFMEGAMTCDGQNSLTTYTKDKCEGYLRIVMQFPLAKNFPFIRRMEFLNSLLCNLAQPFVKEVYLLTDENTEDGDHLLSYFRSQSEEFSPRGSKLSKNTVREILLDRCGKIKPVEHGRRATYKDIVKFINSHSEWKGDPILLTNADISVAPDFSENMVRGLVYNNSAAMLIRQEPMNCNLYGSYFQGLSKTCSCADDHLCGDSYLLSPPLPAGLVTKGRLDGIDFRMGALWNAENVFMERLKQHNLTIRRPCSYLKMAHHHCSQSRLNQKKDSNGIDKLLMAEPLVNLEYEDEKTVGWAPILSEEESAEIYQLGQRLTQGLSRKSKRSDG